MKIHDVCILCLKTCKQPYSEWDDKQPELRFCKNFGAPRSKLPIETLDEFAEDMKKQVELTKGTAQEEQVKKFYQYLLELRKVYIPCSNFGCKHKIAPDELYRIIDEMPVCQGCLRE
jgi:hypothetical protein